MELLLHANFVLQHLIIDQYRERLVCMQNWIRILVIICLPGISLPFENPASLHDDVCTFNNR